MNQTATPRTDYHIEHANVLANDRDEYQELVEGFARTLERENARLREALELIACGADGVTQARAALAVQS